MNIIPGADYRPKFATIMAGDDLPDIMHLFFGYTVAPNLPGLLQGQVRRPDAVPGRRRRQGLSRTWPPSRRRPGRTRSRPSTARCTWCRSTARCRRSRRTAATSSRTSTCGMPSSARTTSPRTPTISSAPCSTHHAAGEPMGHRQLRHRANAVRSRLLRRDLQCAQQLEARLPRAS